MTDRSNTPRRRRAWTKPQVIVGQAASRNPEGKDFSAMGETSFLSYTTGTS